MRYGSQYCGNQACNQTRWFDHTERYCSGCREELTPAIVCLCGEDEYHPRLAYPPKVCTNCGARWTEEYLGQCIKAQLDGMVKEITEKQAALHA